MYRTYSRIRRKIWGKISIFFSPFDLYAGLKSQFLFLKAILGITLTTPLNCLLLKQQSCLNPFKSSSKNENYRMFCILTNNRCFVYSLLVKKPTLRIAKLEGIAFMSSNKTLEVSSFTEPQCLLDRL